MNPHRLNDKQRQRKIASFTYLFLTFVSAVIAPTRHPQFRTAGALRNVTAGVQW
jgi:hypothetical protein